MKLFGKSETGLGVGDRFVEANRERTEWVVEFVFGDPNGVAHARLRKAGDATVARTFAATVLLADPRFKRIAGRVAPAQDLAAIEEVEPSRTA
jgi:hypothetical protein